MRLSHLGAVFGGLFLCLIVAIWLFQSDETGGSAPNIPCRVTLVPWSRAPICDVVIEFNRTSLPDGTRIYAVVTDTLTGIVFGTKSQDIAEIVREQPSNLPKGLAQMRLTIDRACQDMSTDWVSVGIESR